MIKVPMKEKWANIIKEDECTGKNSTTVEDI